jgi:hypothetical protein
MDLHVTTMLPILNSVAYFAGMVWMAGKLRGKDDTKSGYVTEQLSEIKSRLTALEASEESLLITVAKNNTTLFGEFGNNGLNGSIKEIQTKIHAIEHKIDKLVEHMFK